MPQLPPFQEWLVQLISMASSILLALAALFGIRSFWQWRKELVGKTKFEVARRIILLALQFRDEFHAVRGIFTFAGESSERQHGENETESEAVILSEHFARAKRLRTLQDTLRKLHEAGWEADTVLDEHDAKLIEPLEKSFRDLSIAFDFYFRAQYQRAKHPHGHIGIDQTQEDEMHKIVYGLSDDSIGKAVDDAVNALKVQLKPHVN